MCGVTPYVFFHDDRTQNDSVTPYGFFYYYDKKTTVLPLTFPSKQQCNPLRFLQNDIVTPYVLFDDNQ